MNSSMSLSAASYDIMMYGHSCSERSSLNDFFTLETITSETIPILNNSIQQRKTFTENSIYYEISTKLEAKFWKTMVLNEKMESLRIYLPTFI